MLASAGHLILSIFAVALSFALKKQWQSSAQKIWIFLSLFVLSQVGGITLVLTSANSSLSVTITIVVGFCLSAALLIKPLMKLKIHRRRGTSRRDF